MILGRFEFEPKVMRYGIWKITKCLKISFLGSKNGSKNGSKSHFPKVIVAPFGMLKQVFLAHFEPMMTHFGTWKIPKCLEKGAFWDQKWVKNGSKMHFSNNDARPLPMLKQPF